jgi:peptidoglycan/xylan/chitin deacetylase (PgdA/CDA1 family)
MHAPSDNRAVSALFRVFGGDAPVCDAEACQHAMSRGMHPGEWRFLAVWVPLTVVVALGDGLIRHWGVMTGALLALPLGFLVLMLLPLALGGRNPLTQWRLWLGVCTLWALFRVWDGGVAGLVAGSWIGIFALNSAALFLTGWKNSNALRLALFIIAHVAALLAGAWFGGWWALGGGALIAGWYCLAVLRPSCQWLGPVRCRTDDGRILITIDDGPDPHDTPRLLDLLDEHHAKAVFFMIGEKVEAHPELAREVLRRGHEIGNHTMHHPQAGFWCAGPWRTRREIEDCQRVIERVAGYKPRLFRAPVGHRNLFTHPVAAALGLEVMAWSRRGFDAVETDADKVLTRILKNLGAGDIVLLHEATPVAQQVLAGLLSAWRSPRR